MTVRLYDYFRSSACYRVRIALNLKGVAYEAVDISLVDDAQKRADYVAMNPQGFVPMLEIDGHRLTQSLAIMDYLDASYPEPPFVPSDPAARANTLAQALVIACDIHPLNNLRVLRYLGRELAAEEPARDDWYRHWVREGLEALEKLAEGAGRFLGGDRPNMADICLVPQMFNARRFATPLENCPNLVRIDAECQLIEAVAKAHPEQVGTAA